VLELPFRDEQDAANEGNAPYDSIVNGVPTTWRITGPRYIRRWPRGRPGRR
jgi:hypothetical protein